MKRLGLLAGSMAVILSVGAVRGVADDRELLRQEIQAAMHKAATFYCAQAASHGGFVYYYSLDLQRRWGEGEAEADQIWVQPPGTPTVGLALLKAYAATGDAFYLAAAQQAAEALIHGQLASGGWANCIDFNPRGGRVSQYRNGSGRGANNSTLDDGISQAAIRLLIHADQATGFKHHAIHDAAQIALAALLKAQYPNGGFPQVWTGPVPAQPAVKASFPTYDWRTQGKIKNYWDMYTLNDGIAGNVAAALQDALDVYHEQKYRDSLERLGDFLILAQLPDPQPAWAQQYSYEMHPIWARRFEPPAVTGGESQDAMETLLAIHRVTGNDKYLQPIPRALGYLKRSLLPDGRLARYYELLTNKPLYMQRSGRQYTLVYDDGDLPSHYGWKVASRLASIQSAYDAAAGHSASTPTRAAAADTGAEAAKQIVAALDHQGRWVSVYRGERLTGQPKFEAGFQYLSSDVFSRNLEKLSDFLMGTR